MSAVTMDVKTQKLALSWFGGCAGAMVVLAGLLYWNEVVIPRQAVDDMCEAKYSHKFDPTRDFLGQYGWQNEKDFYKFQKHQINRCKVAGYARINGAK